MTSRLLTSSSPACTEDGQGEVLEMFRHGTTAGVHCENKAKAHAYRHACLNFLSEVSVRRLTDKSVTFFVVKC